MFSFGEDAARKVEEQQAELDSLRTELATAKAELATAQAGSGGENTAAVQADLNVVCQQAGSRVELPAATAEVMATQHTCTHTSHNACVPRH